MIVKGFYKSIRHKWADRNYVLLIFSLGCLIRGIPLLLSYPYPEGYDVINYYIPAVKFFDERWSLLLHEYPVYVYLLHLVNLSTGLNPYHTVMTGAVSVFGIFSVSLFYVAKRILSLKSIESVFLSVFVVVQFAVLRTSWDLHRDMFALTILLFTLVLIYDMNQRNIRWKPLACGLILCALTATSDGMVGALFILTLIAYSIVARTKAVIFCTIVALLFFSLAIFPAQNNFHIIMDLNLSQKTATGKVDSAYYIEDNSNYKSTNLIIFFFIVNALLIPPAIYGVSNLSKRGASSLLLILPVLISFSLTVLAIMFPENTTLVAHRWSILLGVFLSIFAAYGIMLLVNNQKTFSSIKKITILSFILSGFIVIGMGYAVMPPSQPFILFDAAKSHMQTMSPLTMQPNKGSMDDLISDISWINKNTEKNSTIVGEKGIRGAMQLYLEPERRWEDFGLSIDATTSARFFTVLDWFVTDSGNFYLVTANKYFLDHASDKFEYAKVHSGNTMTVFKLKRAN